ncbi:hypothetical protein RND71_013847 [Anisodus tanguticus]|uniref:XRCC4 N-terminal domain-containing protein n=1 Tax=Anisodus tanguticus TaxID=243964 RepID=A0AAE1SA90_9SOLA|nr:hypothetical protein RND71_013847 [Anisodus tanguticus]
MGSESPKHTCLKLEIPRDKEQIFVKGTCFSSHFDLFITDGLQAWTCHASEEEVEERASQWDQPVSEYIDLGEKYLRFQQPGSVYGFDDAGSGHKRGKDFMHGRLRTNPLDFLNGAVAEWVYAGSLSYSIWIGGLAIVGCIVGAIIEGEPWSNCPSPDPEHSGSSVHRAALFYCCCYDWFPKICLSFEHGAILILEHRKWNHLGLKLLDDRSPTI